MTTYLVTGTAGFIGFHVAKQLLERGDSVIGLDNLTPYYDVQLKRDRLEQLDSQAKFAFSKSDLNERRTLESLFTTHAFDVVIHLAAQAGVRYSIENPYSYIDSNLVGFAHILEGCRHHQVKHLVYASSSSVYGAKTTMAFSVHQNVDHPLSLYAATKKANELMAHTYSHLFRLPTSGLRFFTVYGPWGRPDMALFKFTKAILADESIDIYNHGDMRRDFTYIDDIVEGILRVADNTAQPNPDWSGDNPDPATSSAPSGLYNIGNNNPVELLRMIDVLEECLGKKAKRNLLPMQPGDVPATYADIDDLVRDVDFQPSTTIETGVANFVAWYRSYYKV